MLDISNVALEIPRYRGNKKSLIMEMNTNFSSFEEWNSSENKIKKIIQIINQLHLIHPMLKCWTLGKRPKLIQQYKLACDELVNYTDEADKLCFITNPSL